MERSTAPLPAWCARSSLATHCPRSGPTSAPVITSALWGAEMNFAPNTVWCDPIYHDVSRWHEFLKTPPNFGTFYWQIVEQMTEYALSIADGRFLVGITDLHGNYDILASLRGSEELCVDMIEEPQLVAAAAMHAARGFNEAFRRQWAQISPKQNVGTCWTPVYHPGPAFVPSCDFWCMVSPKMGRELVLPSIVEEMRLLERSIFHLDGPQALPQLDALLGLPNLNAVQWIYGAGQEPAGKWLDVYRKIVAAGKSAQVVADDGADALKVLDALGPKGLWFTINKPFESARAAREFLADFAPPLRPHPARSFPMTAPSHRDNFLRMLHGEKPTRLPFDIPVTPPIVDVIEKNKGTRDVAAAFNTLLWRYWSAHSVRPRRLARRLQADRRRRPRGCRD